jgi:hypothetical protein
MNAIGNLLLRLVRCSSGASMVEAAILLPILISLMAGGLEFARAFWVSSTADKSMRDAARYLARVPQADVCTWGLTKAKKLAVFGNLDGTGPTLIGGWSISNVTLQQPSDCSSAFSVIQLQADVPFTALTWSVLGLSNSITMHVRHQERWIGE